MPKFVSKMTSSTFTMRLPLDEKTAIEVTITGKGFSFDRESGMLLRGTIDSISLSDLTLTGRRFSVVETHKIGGVNMAAERLADVAGDKFWNHIKTVVDLFEKFSNLHEGISHSYLSPDKNVITGSDFNDKLAGTKVADVMTGGGGDDRLTAGAGDDRIYGGKGNDFMNGGAGDDYMIDHYGTNTLNGGAGNDRMLGGSDADQLSGSTGRDMLYGAGGIDRLTGGRDADVFVFNTKEESRITITDFDRGDMLVDLVYGRAEVTFKYFEDRATQVGKDVVYEDGAVHLTLKNFKLGDLSERNFMDADIVKEAGLLF